MPSVEELEAELKRETYRKRYRRTLRSTVYMLITVAAAAVLVATLVLPVLQIYGSSMTPTLTDGDIVVSVAGKNLERQDIIAFYYNNKILVKRVIATAGQWVDISEDGFVTVDGEPLDEPYVYERALESVILTYLTRFRRVGYLSWGIIAWYRLTAGAQRLAACQRNRLSGSWSFAYGRFPSSDGLNRKY